MLHQALGLLLQQPAEAVELLILGQAPGLDAVEQVVVEVPRPGLFQLFGEYPLHVLPGVEEAAVQLCGQREAVAGIALHQRLARHPLAGKAVVHDGRVEVGEAPLHEQVHHPLHLLNIHLRRVRRVQLRHAHQAKAKLFHVVASLS